MAKALESMADLKENPVYTHEELVDILSTCSDLLRHPDYISIDHLTKLAGIKGWPDKLVDEILTMCNQVNDYIYG